MRRVAIAAGDPGYGAALAFLVDGEPDLLCVGSATDAAALVELVIENEVDVVAVDLGLLAGTLAPLRAALLDVERRCGLVALGALDTPSARAAALKSGAIFAAKADAPGLLSALRAVPG